MSGRPSAYSPEIVDAICVRLEDGESLAAICREGGMPSQSMVYRWLEANEAFRERYARARERQAHTMADMAIRDAIEAKDAALGRLAFDARRWFAGKLAPKVYGDKLELDATVRAAVSAEPLTEEAWVATYGVAPAGGTAKGPR
jgi:hypothetical protein